MNRSDESPPEHYVRLFAPLLNELYRLVDEACQFAQEQFERWEEERPQDETSISNEPFLHADLVRFKIVHGIENGRVAQVTRRHLGNNGIEIQYENYRIRVLKSRDGELPSPGRSFARQMFFAQFGRFRDRNFVVLWEPDQNGLLSQLYLACPRAGRNGWTKGKAHWIEAVPHPATQGQEIFSEIPEEIDVTAIEAPARKKES